MKLVNTAKNKILLGEIANIHVLDLSILFFICRKEQDVLLTRLITHEYLELWGVTENDLLEAAQENAKDLLPARIRDIREVLHKAVRERMGASYSKKTADEVLNRKEDKGPMYVLKVNQAKAKVHDILRPHADILVRIEDTEKKHTGKSIHPLFAGLYFNHKWELVKDTLPESEAKTEETSAETKEEQKEEKEHRADLAAKPDRKNKQKEKASQGLHSRQRCF